MVCLGGFWLGLLVAFLLVTVPFGVFFLLLLFAELFGPSPPGVTP